VIVDSLDAVNTGNALFLRIGARSGNRKSSLSGVSVSHLTVQIPAGKPDSGYEYEGPVQDEPRNISPIVLAGLPDAFLRDIRLSDLVIRYPGGGNPFVANRSLTALDSIPELAGSYPDFSMFKELPAWGLYIRHARGVRVRNLSLLCEAKDYRTAIVLDDVREAGFERIVVKEPGNKKSFFLHASSGVVIK
jgi:hypothetical protein